MDYEAADRYMSSWVVACTKQTTRFYLTDAGLATDWRSRARIFRHYDQAEDAAIDACNEQAWAGFAWAPMSVPEMLSTSDTAPARG